MFQPADFWMRAAHENRFFRPVISRGYVTASALGPHVRVPVFFFRNNHRCEVLFRIVGSAYPTKTLVVRCANSANPELLSRSLLLYSVTHGSCDGPILCVVLSANCAFGASGQRQVGGGRIRPVRQAVPMTSHTARDTSSNACPDEGYHMLGV